MRAAEIYPKVRADDAQTTNDRLWRGNADLFRGVDRRR